MPQQNWSLYCETNGVTMKVAAVAGRGAIGSDLDGYCSYRILTHIFSPDLELDTVRLDMDTNSEFRTRYHPNGYITDSGWKRII